MYKVRFNLGRGENYKKWKIVKTNDNSYQIFDPEKGSLIMKNCELKNNKNGAKKIFKGKNKFVVAWILCESFEFVEDMDFGLEYDPCRDPEVSYNPRCQPNWDCFGQNFDGYKEEEMYTILNKVYIKC